MTTQRLPSRLYICMICGEAGGTMVKRPMALPNGRPIRGGGGYVHMRPGMCKKRPLDIEYIIPWWRRLWDWIRLRTSDGHNRST